MAAFIRTQSFLLPALIDVLHAKAEVVHWIAGSRGHASVQLAAHRRRVSCSEQGCVGALMGP
jgi:hypothetical protein